MFSKGFFFMISDGLNKTAKTGILKDSNIVIKL